MLSMTCVLCGMCVWDLARLVRQSRCGDKRLGIRVGHMFVYSAVLIVKGSTPRTDHDLDHRFPLRDLELSRADTFPILHDLQYLMRPGETHLICVI